MDWRNMLMEGIITGIFSLVAVFLSNIFIDLRSYKKIDRKIGDFRDESLSIQHRDIKDNIKQAEIGIENKISYVSSKVDNIDKEIYSNKEKYLNLNLDQREIKDSINKLLLEWQTLVVENKELRAQNEAFKLENSRNRVDNEKIKEDLSKLLSSNNKLISDNTKLIAENKEIKEKLDRVTSDSSKVIFENKEIKSELSRLREENSSIMSEKEKFRIEMYRLKGENTILIKENNKLNNELENEDEWERD